MWIIYCFFGRPLLPAGFLPAAGFLAAAFFTFFAAGVLVFFATFIFLTFLAAGFLTFFSFFFFSSLGFSPSLKDPLGPLALLALPGTSFLSANIFLTASLTRVWTLAASLLTS